MIPPVALSTSGQWVEANSSFLSGRLRPPLCLLTATIIYL